MFYFIAFAFIMVTMQSVMNDMEKVRKTSTRPLVRGFASAMYLVALGLAAVILFFIAQAVL